MGERMTWEEMVLNYPDRWVVLKDTEKDGPDVLSGVLVAVKTDDEIIPFENEKAAIVEDGIEELDAILGALLTNNVNDAKEKIKTHEFLNAKELFLELLNLKTDKEKVVYFLNNQYC